MWINQLLYCLLAVAHLYLPNLVHSQDTDSSHIPQNLKCITHDLKTVICTWTTASATSLGITYRFCPTFSSSTGNCSETADKVADFPLMLFDPFTIKVFTLNSGKVIAENTFKLSDMDISFVPPTPHIYSLTPDFSTNTLFLEWKDGGAVFPQKLSATWEIQILRKDPMEEVAQKTYHSQLMAVDTVLHWNWTSDIPFECTTHYVRIRSFLHERDFPGNKEWSEWSQFANISGQDTDSSLNTLPAVYPIDKVVLVGSNVTCCCVWKTGQRFITLGYDACEPSQCPTVRLSNLSMLIYATNVRSFPSGTNVYCEMELTEKTYYGTVIFAGYPPDVPQNLNCETQDMKNLMCKWGVGRPTKLYGPRSTKYSVLERISGKNITTDYNGLAEEISCNFQILNKQTAHHVTVFASNDLGQSEASLEIDVNQRIRPRAPSHLEAISSNSTNIRLSWYLDGSFTHISLRCQISRSNSSKILNVPLEGAENSRYNTTINKLLPYTTYKFRVRCSAAPPLFWKWSNWSTVFSLTTSEAPPTKALDVWRERSSDGETVNVFWKSLPVSERNGVIQSYEVSCFLPDMPKESKSIPETQNSTEIKIGGNDCILTVVAKNKGGSSPPSQINSAEILTDDAITENGIATGDGIYIAWPPDSNVICGFIVRWCQPSESEPCVVNWEAFPSNATNAVIKSALFQPGVRYTFSLYGCKSNGYQLLKYVHGYTKELEPSVAPLFKVEKATSDSIWIKWENIPVVDSRGFLKGYMLHFSKEEEGSKNLKSCTSGHPEACINITDLKQNTLQISSLQGKTSYYLNLYGYTAGGIGPSSSLYVVTKENSVGLIIAIIIPVAIVVVLGIVTSILCYRKREWIKETFYPDIPNPESCKALDFPKDPEGNPNVKTLEMNPCTPNNIEVIETQSPCLKIEDTAMISPVAGELPEDGFDSETESHIVVSYCPPIIEEEISNAPIDESAGSSQVIYIDIQSMYPAADKLKEEAEVDCVAAAGYKPQMQLPVNSAGKMDYASAAEEDVDKAAGYRPQVNAPSWNKGCPDSPTSIESNNENASFGSPCSISSRQFLIPSKEDDDSLKANSIGWSFTNFFHNKSND
ncbi:leukemia inhibitory factor receptor-like [Tiliqua scincoides]|uniref:leukemia inhibitory factor receptor-like n=1 Tax=Tiliqua scincoides TaxID=71010 RepID=UPI0034625E00